MLDDGHLKGWYFRSSFLPSESRVVVRTNLLSKSSRDGGIHRLPRAWLVDVGMLQVREVAVCRAVRRHIGHVAQVRV